MKLETEVFIPLYFFFKFKYSLGGLFAAHISLSADLLFKIKLHINKHFKLRSLILKLGFSRLLLSKSN